MVKRFIVTIIAGITIVGGTAGCQTAKPETVKPVPIKTATIRVGTLPVEDGLPIFVAAKNGYFKKNHLNVEIVNFQSALECDAAFQAGQIDGFMGDILGAALLDNAGNDVSIVTTVLGATAKEGRFAIVAAPNSGITTVDQLKNVPIATASNTVIDYMIHQSLKDKGFTPAEIQTIEVKKLPVRMQMLLAGQIKAAGLPNLMVVLAEKQGGKIIVDDTKAENLSQTVILFKTSFIKGDKSAIGRFLTSLNQAAAAINKAPKAYTALLVEKANLPAGLAQTFQVSHYPQAGLPAPKDVNRLLNWMKSNHTIKDDITYSRLTMEVKPK